MRRIIVQPPASAGAVKLELYGENGGERLNTRTLIPSDDGWSVDVARDKNYTLVWRSLGGRTTTIPIAPGEEDITLFGPSAGEEIAEFRGESSSELVKSALRTIRSFEAKAGPAKDRPIRAARSQAATWERIQTRATKFGAEMQKRALPPPPPASFEAGRDATWTSLRVAQPMGRFAIGVASDGTPRRYGGWKPYFGRWPIKVLRNYGRVTLHCERGHDEYVDPEGLDGSRVRISLGVQDRGLRRFLVPLYAGGVDVVIRSAGVTGDDLTFEINPCDPDLKVLVQALSIVSAADAKSIADETKRIASRYMNNIRTEKLYDPWMAIVLGMTVKRHGWEYPCDWATQLAERFPWISDTLVLAAWWCSTRRGGRDYGKSLDYLSAARKRGSLYLSETNATMRDLLVMLSDEDDEALAKRARQELAAWRTKVPFQTWGGANFAWVVDKASTNGRLPGMSDRIVLEGKLDEFLGSQDPNKGKFGGESTRNGRAVSNRVSATEDPDIFAIALEVRSTDPARPLTGQVEFHLHPTFRAPVRKMPVIDGAARLDLRAWGAFTLGVVCDGGKTKLELDLAQNPDAPALFRSR